MNEGRERFWTSLHFLARVMERGRVYQRLTSAQKNSSNYLKTTQSVLDGQYHVLVFLISEAVSLRQKRHNMEKKIIASCRLHWECIQNILNLIARPAL